MPNEKDGKTHWVGTMIEEPLHTALMEIGTTMGKHPRLVIELALERFVVEWTAERELKGKSVPNRVKLEQMSLEESARQTQIALVKKLAYAHVEMPTDESQERLENACTLAGVSVESVLEMVNSKPHIIAYASEGTTLSTAEHFLLELMEPGALYAANDVFDMGNSRGVKDYLIKEAKRKLGIKSSRKANQWYWFIPERTPDADAARRAKDDPVF